MKKGVFIVSIIMILCGPAGAQTIDWAKYKKTTLPDYAVWRDGANAEDTKKFKAVVLFFSQYGSSVDFYDGDNVSLTGFETRTRWPALNVGQEVVIYFTARGYATPVLDYIDDRSIAVLLEKAATASQPPISTRPVIRPPVEIVLPEPAPPLDPPVISLPTPPEREVLPDPAPPPPDPSPSPDPAPPPPDPSPSPAPVPTVTAKILGSIPPVENRKTYRLQVGAFKVQRNAVDVYNRLKNGGLNPAYERYLDFIRVVLPGIEAQDVFVYAEQLGALGFTEVLSRLER
jgi:hypothetical protein